MSRTVTGQVLTSAHGPAAKIRVAEDFEYVGGQSFVLRGHTDVEQHFFVIADDSGAVEKMYWLQFEAKLPHNEGDYSYPETDKVLIGNLDFVTHVRRYDSEPANDSDRGAAYRFLAGQGYRVPTPASRARLVHIPVTDRRKELMIVYLEAVSDPGEIPPDSAEALEERAAAGLVVTN